MEATGKVNNKVVKHVVYLQTAVTLLGSLIGLIFDIKSAQSALFGGAVGTIGTLVLALVMFAGKELSAKQMLMAFYIGEATKLCITIILYVAAFAWLEVRALPFILAFIATQVVNWLGLLKIE